MRLQPTAPITWHDIPDDFGKFLVSTHTPIWIIAKWNAENKEYTINVIVQLPTNERESETLEKELSQFSAFLTSNIGYASNAFEALNYFRQYVDAMRKEFPGLNITPGYEDDVKRLARLFGTEFYAG